VEDIEPNEIFFDLPKILSSEKNFKQWVSDWASEHPDQADGLQAYLRDEDEQVCAQLLLPAVFLFRSFCCCCIYYLSCLIECFVCFCS
jgi:hypothetical protein